MSCPPRALTLVREPQDSVPYLNDKLALPGPAAAYEGWSFIPVELDSLFFGHHPPDFSLEAGCQADPGVGCCR